MSANIYTLSYANIKANDPTIHDYLAPMPFKKNLENVSA